jgi:hypothetical protein
MGQGPSSRGDRHPILFNADEGNPILRRLTGRINFSTAAVKRSAADQVSLDVDNVVDGGVDGDKTPS